jgi:hypothetical protein
VTSLKVLRLALVLCECASAMTNGTKGNVENGERGRVIVLEIVMLCAWAGYSDNYIVAIGARAIKRPS